MIDENELLKAVARAASHTVPINTIQHKKGDPVKYYVFTVKCSSENFERNSKVNEISAEVLKVNSDHTYDIKLTQPPRTEEKSFPEKYLYPINKG